MPRPTLRLSSKSSWQLPQLPLQYNSRKRLKQPSKPSRPQQSSSFRPKGQTKSYPSNRKDYAKRSGNQKQFPSSKQASSSTKFWSPTLSTAGPATSRCSSGRRLAHFVEQWEELTNNKWVLSIDRNGFKIPFKSVPPLSVVLINLSQSSSPLLREEIVEPQKTGSGKGSESGNSQFLFLAIPGTQKERKVTSRNRPILTKPLYTQTALQNGDSQVGKTMDYVQRLGCLHRSNGSISSGSDTSDFQEVPTVSLQPPGISVHGLTIRNVLKSVGFHEANERHSNTFTSTCSISISIPRRLADKRSNAQLTYSSHQIYSSNGSKSRLHSKSKEVRFNSNTTIHIYRYGISNSTKNSQSSCGSSKSSYSDHQNNSLTNSGIGTDFPFSFGQTKCSSRLSSSGQIAFTTPANVPIIGLETSQTSSRSSNYDYQDDQISFKMVDELQSICSGNTHSPSRPPNLPLHGCQSFWLGSSSRTDEYPFMVAGRKTNYDSISTCWK